MYEFPGLRFNDGFMVSRHIVLRDFAFIYLVLFGEKVCGERIRTNNAIERLNREIRRRTRVVGTFPDGKSALMLVTARLKYVADSEWGSRRYLDVSLLDE